VSRLPILVKLTAAFAAATLLMLALAASFVYLRLRADLDDRVNANLHARAQAAATALRQGTDLESVAVEDPEESFAQVLSAEGGVHQTAGAAAGPVISPTEVSQALARDIVVEHRLPGIDGKAKILATGYPSAGPAVVIAIGQSLLDRDDALSSVVQSFVVGGLATLVIASVAGYALARSGLAPVEAMRVRASQISASDDHAGLPLPSANDQIRRLGETLNDMLRRLRESYERERRFVDDASHELRTPLAVIQTDLEGALMAGGHQDDVEDALLSALGETQRLARIADDLLVLARAAGGHLPIDPQPVSVNELMYWARERFAAAAAASERSITLTVPHGAVLLADHDRLRQLLINLIDNALRHGRGDITLEARLVDDGVNIEVKDEGAGFPAWFAPRAFDRLARVDARDRTKGAGLGLAIVREIANAHGGRAEVTAGRPVIARVWLPLRPRP
jgi:signal transduction histidine kinase